MKPRRSEGYLGALILVGIVLFALFVTLAPDADSLGDGAGSISSPKPKGRRALFVTLSELGLAARAWQDAPNSLPRDHSLLWLPIAPTKNMPGDDGFDSSARPIPERIGLHSLDHYRSFVEGGGTLVLPFGDETTRFLVDEMGLEDAAGLALDDSAEASVRSVRTAGGDLIAVLAGKPGVFEPLDQNSRARELWTVEYDGVVRPFAIEIPDAAGSVVVLASDSFVANDSIGSNDNALAAVRLIEDLHKGGEILFSEYELGAWSPPSLLGLLASPKLVLASIHGLVLLALFVWMHAFARAFPRDPEALSLFSPHLRARALANVFARARRFGTLALLLRRGVLDRLNRAARVRPTAPAEANQSGASSRRVRPDDVSALARQASLTEIEPALLELLVTRAVRRREDLDALDADLRELETEIDGHLKRRAALVASGT